MRTPRTRIHHNPKIADRRRRVIEWFLSGCVYMGQIMQIDQFAMHLGVKPVVVKKDLKVMRSRMVKRIKTVPSLERTLLLTITATMDMILQDRGRALEQYERLRGTLVRRDGTPVPPVGRDYHEIGYQMAAFLKLAQSSTDQLGKLIHYLMPRDNGEGGVSLVINSSGPTTVNTLTSAEAIKLIEGRKAAAALPVGQIRAVDLTSEIIDVTDSQEASS